MTPLRVRDLTRNDVPTVAAIAALTFPTPWPPAAFASEVGRPRSRFFVGELNGAVIGFVGTWIVLDEAHIATIAVHPQHQRHGYGEYLLIWALTDAQAHGAQSALLEVRESNTSAQCLYARYGFEAVGRRKGYYKDTGEDALLLTARPIHTRRVEYPPPLPPPT